MTIESDNKANPNIKDIEQKIKASEFVLRFMPDLDEKKAFCELIDNAIDETTPGMPTDIVITLDSRDRRIIFENRNTPGMDDRHLEEYCQFYDVGNTGNVSDRDKIREHHIGGKMAALSFLSPEKSSLSITSGLKGTNTVNLLKIDNWWNSLDDGKIFPREAYVGEYNENGYSRFILEGVREVPLNVAEIADHLGSIYGKLIEKGKIKISFISIRKGGKPTSLEVIPIIIPFKEDSYNEKEVTLQTESNPKILVKWGNIDLEERKLSENNRREAYELKKPDSIQGNNLYIYYHGRLLSISPLSSLKILGYTNKFVFQTFVIEADITNGWISKKVYKDGLSLASPDTKSFLNNVVKIVEKDVIEMTKEPDRDLEMQRLNKKTSIANPVLASTLKKIFNNDLKVMAQTFGLTSEDEHLGSRNKINIRTELNNKTDRKPSLPGSGSSHKTRSENIKRKLTNPIPEFSISSFGENSPEAVFYIHSDSTSTLIDLNTDNPFIKHLLQQRGKVLLTGLLFIGAKALYHEKWVRKANNLHEYYLGMDKDIANFLITASEIS